MHEHLEAILWLESFFPEIKKGVRLEASKVGFFFTLKIGTAPDLANIVKKLFGYTHISILQPFVMAFVKATQKKKETIVRTRQHFLLSYCMDIFFVVGNK
jgi:hypothetical protein